MKFIIGDTLKKLFPFVNEIHILSKSGLIIYIIHFHPVKCGSELYIFLIHREKQIALDYKLREIRGPIGKDFRFRL